MEMKSQRLDTQQNMVNQMNLVFPLYLLNTGIKIQNPDDLGKNFLQIGRDALFQCISSRLVIKYANQIKSNLIQLNFPPGANNCS